MLRQRLGVSILLLSLTFVIAGGCAETRFEQATGEGTVRGVNAIEGFADVTFLIEELVLGSIAFRDSTATQTYDDLNYTFNFDLPDPARNSLRRVASTNIDVVDGIDYIFVLAGDTSAQEVLVWQRELRDWSEDETVFDVTFGHLDPGFGDVDLYIAAPGTMPVAGNAVGSLSFGERLDPVELESGDYQVILTPPGDPATILYQSISASYPAAQSFTVALFEADPGFNGPASLRRIGQGGGTPASLADERFPPTIQFLHASPGTGNVDVAVDGDFAAPSVTDLAFGEVTADVDVVAGTANYDFLPAGNTMSLLELELNLPAGARSLVQLIGEPGDLSALVSASVRRGFSTVARVRVTNTVTGFDALDVYFREPGTDIEDIAPDIFGATFGFSSLAGRIPGDFELIITQNGETTVLGGPIPVTFAADDVLEVILLDTADPNRVDALVFSNVNP